MGIATESHGDALTAGSSTQGSMKRLRMAGFDEQMLLRETH
jgi:hypothetical protein